MSSPTVKLMLGAAEQYQTAYDSLQQQKTQFEADYQNEEQRYLELEKWAPEVLAHPEQYDSADYQRFKTEYEAARQAYQQNQQIYTDFHRAYDENMMNLLKYEEQVTTPGVIKYSITRVPQATPPADSMWKPVEGASGVYVNQYGQYGYETVGPQKTAPTPAPVTKSPFEPSKASLLSLTDTTKMQSPLMEPSEAKPGEILYPTLYERSLQGGGYESSPAAAAENIFAPLAEMQRQTSMELFQKAGEANVKGDLSVVPLFLGASITRLGASIYDTLTFPVRPTQWINTAETMFTPAGWGRMVGAVQRDPYGVALDVAGGVMGGYVLGAAAGSTLDRIFGKKTKITELEEVKVVQKEGLFTAQGDKVTMQVQQATITPTKISSKKLPRGMGDLLESSDLNRLLVTSDDVASVLDIGDAFDNILQGKPATVKQVKYNLQTASRELFPESTILTSADDVVKVKSIDYFKELNLGAGGEKTSYLFKRGPEASLEIWGKAPSEVPQVSPWDLEAAMRDLPESSFTAKVVGGAKVVSEQLDDFKPTKIEPVPGATSLNKLTQPKEWPSTLIQEATVRDVQTGLKFTGPIPEYSPTIYTSAVKAVAELGIVERTISATGKVTQVKQIPTSYGVQGSFMGAVSAVGQIGEKASVDITPQTTLIKPVTSQVTETTAKIAPINKDTTILDLKPLQSIATVSQLKPIEKARVAEKVVPVYDIKNIEKNSTMELFKTQTIQKTKPVETVKQIEWTKQVEQSKTLELFKSEQTVKPVLGVKPVLDVKPIMEYKPIFDVKPMTALNTVTVTTTIPPVPPPIFYKPTPTLIPPIFNRGSPGGGRRSFWRGFHARLQRVPVPEPEKVWQRFLGKTKKVKKN